MTKTTELPPAVGDCYKAAFYAVSKMPRLTLCHGVCTGHGPIEGIPFDHAWAEDEHWCYDFANGKRAVVPKSTYYKAGQCREVVRYTVPEMLRMAVKHEHYGPWHETNNA